MSLHRHPSRLDALGPRLRSHTRGLDRRTRQGGRSIGIEPLEGRAMLATFAVTNLNNDGPGSLRDAITRANSVADADVITFPNLSGTIALTAALPVISAPVSIDGTTGKAFAAAPVVTVDFANRPGLQFNTGSDGSTLASLALVRANGAGVTLDASRITLQGNYIGLLADGTTAAGNRGDGLKINAGSSGNLIGSENPVTGINYFTPANMSIQPVAGLQGLRGGDVPGQYLISGTSTDAESDGILFVGPITATGGTTYPVRVPGAQSTSVYGPDNLGAGQVRLVGSYINAGSSTRHGFLFEGTTTDLTNGTGTYTTIDADGATFTYVHSTMGGLAVGNDDGPTVGVPQGTGQAFIYDVATKQFVRDIRFPGSLSTTAYGIWHNGGTSYTICGGFSQFPFNNGGDQNQPLGQAFLADYDSATGQFSHWKAFSYPSGQANADVLTHFEGISSTEKGVYTLAASALQAGSTPLGSFVSVRRNTDGSFGDGAWVDVTYPGSGAALLTSVYGNAVTGVGVTSGGVQWFQATIDTGFLLSNVISGNRGNGIGIYGSNDNQIGMNFIGTAASGRAAVPNAANGILVTNKASRNLIGGEATGGNDPTAGTFVRPPQGNLISGNAGNGVLIVGGATETLLSGNFIGTTRDGNAALGNALDGVAIENAHGNSLIGCTFQQSPFVFYNVLSGNRGNGLRITNSNDTTVQANFFGVGANNATIVANGGDGLLVSGTSRNTQVGGVIPLGNVMSGNNRHGIEIRDTVSGLTSFNSFVGQYAFGGKAANRLNGIMVTSTGGNNLIRTCLVGGNLGNGIEISGNATGVQITDTGCGTTASLSGPIPNGGSGIVLSGNAYGNIIGGDQFSIQPQVTLSGNRRYGLEVVGAAKNNRVFSAVIGGSGGGPGVPSALPNSLGGIFLGPGTSGTTIGGGQPNQAVQVLYNGGAGITIVGSTGNSVRGCTISMNVGDGIAVTGGRNNAIGSALAGNSITQNGGNGLAFSGQLLGSTMAGNVVQGNGKSGLFLKAVMNLTVGGGRSVLANTIVTNAQYGVYAVGNCTGTAVVKNVVKANKPGNVNITSATGITYIP